MRTLKYITLTPPDFNSSVIVECYFSAEDAHRLQIRFEKRAWVQRSTLLVYRICVEK
jgi:hypothetical protein